MVFKICLVESFWSPLPGHLAVEVFFALCLYLFQVSRYYFLLRRRFHKVTFDIFYKGSNRAAVRVATTKVNWSWAILEPVIEYEGRQNETRELEGEFEGEFVMNPINLKIGQGVHSHLSYDGFNFPKVFIKDHDTFFVETTYLSPASKKDLEGGKDPWDYTEKFQAYVWKRRHYKERAYPVYLRLMHRLSEKNGYPVDQLELFLFQFGRNLKTAVA